MLARTGITSIPLILKSPLNAGFLEQNILEMCILEVYVLDFQSFSGSRSSFLMTLMKRRLFLLRAGPYEIESGWSSFAVYISILLLTISKSFNPWSSLACVNLPFLWIGRQRFDDGGFTSPTHIGCSTVPSLVPPVGSSRLELAVLCYYKFRRQSHRIK